MRDGREAQPSPLTLVDLIGPWESSNALALRIDGHDWSFHRLATESSQFARSLLKLGVSAGDRVSIAATNSVEWACGMLGTAMVGAVLVPISTRYRRRELGFILQDSDPAVVLLEDEVSGNPLGDMLSEHVHESGGDLRDGSVSGIEGRALHHMVVLGSRRDPFASWKEFMSLGDDVSARALRHRISQVGSEDAAQIHYTSGTTAFPKGVLLSHNGLARSAVETARRMALEHDSIHFAPQPFYHTGGMVPSLLSSLAAGCATLSQRMFDPGEALDIIEANRCTHHGGVSSIYVMEYEHPSFSSRRTESLGVMRTTGAPETLRRHHSAMGGRPTNAYGLTEMCAVVTMADALDPLETALETCGRPLSGLSLRIVDAEGGQVRNGEEGQIQVKGWSMMLGYLGLERETSATITEDGWLTTGDQGILDDGGRLHFLGRLKELIRVGGHNVSPMEVEDVLSQHPAVVQAHAFGVPEGQLDEIVAVALQVREGDRVSDEELTAFCKRSIASYKVPRVYVHREDFPMTPSLKVSRMELRREYLEGLSKEPG